jgi:hypothetical protein
MTFLLGNSMDITPLVGAVVTSSAAVTVAITPTTNRTAYLTGVSWAFQESSPSAAVALSVGTLASGLGSLPTYVTYQTRGATSSGNFTATFNPPLPAGSTGSGITASASGDTSCTSCYITVWGFMV